VFIGISVRWLQQNSGCIYLAPMDSFAPYIMKQMEMAECSCNYSKNIFLIGATKPQYIYNHK
jgi:hypothetical protein